MDGVYEIGKDSKNKLTEDKANSIHLIHVVHIVHVVCTVHTCSLKYGKKKILFKR